MPSIQKRIDYFKNTTDEPENIALLQTIRIPKNLLFLSDKLPKANYGKNNITNLNNNKKNSSFSNKNENELPDIKMPLSKINSNVISKKKKPEELPEKKNSALTNLINEINLKGIDNNGLNNSDEVLIKNQIKKKQKNSVIRKNELVGNNYNSLNLLENPKVEEIAHVYLDGVYNKKTRSHSPKLDILIGLKQQKMMDDKGVHSLVNREPIKYSKYISKNLSNGSNKQAANPYLKNIEKYYNIYNVYKPKKNLELISNKRSIIPNSKLMPLKKI